MSNEISTQVPDMLTQESLAARLGCTSRTIRTWTKDEILPCIRIGRYVYYNWPDVVDALRERCGVGYRTKTAEHTNNPGL